MNVLNVNEKMCAICLNKIINRRLDSKYNPSGLLRDES